MLLRALPLQQTRCPLLSLYCRESLTEVFRVPAVLGLDTHYR